MAAKRQVPMGRKSSKFVVGKQKSVDVWRTSRPPKKYLGAKPGLKKGRGKMAAKRQIPMGQKSSKFVVGKPKSVDVWRTSRPPKKSLGAKPVLKRGVAKWPPNVRSQWAKK